MRAPFSFRDPGQSRFAWKGEKFSFAKKLNLKAEKNKQQNQIKAQQINCQVKKILNIGKGRKYYSRFGM